MGCPGWTRGILCLFFSQSIITFAQDSPEPKTESFPCPVVQVEVLGLYDTGQWDFFTSTQNEFFFDVYTDAATSRGNGSTSQILTPPPLPTYYSDPEQDNIQVHHGLMAFIPTAEANQVGVTWLENDTLIGTLSRDSADKVAEGFLFLDKIKEAPQGLERTLSGKKQSGKRPRAKFKFTCVDIDVHAQAQDHVVRFQTHAVDKSDLSLEEFPDNPVLRTQLQESLVSVLEQATAEISLNVQPQVHRLAFQTLDTLETLTARLQPIQDLKNELAGLYEKQQQIAATPGADIEPILDAIVDAKIRLRKLELALVTEVVSLDVWLTGDFLSLISDDYKKHGLGQFVLHLWQRVTLTEPTEGVTPKVHEQGALTLGFQGDYLSLLDEVINGKLGQYPLGNLYQQSYQTVADVFNHLTYLNVLSNRQSFSVFLNAEADRVFIYGFDLSSMVPMWGAVDAHWVTLSTESVGLNQADRLEETRRALLFLLTFANAGRLGLDPKILAREYLADIKNRLKLLPRDIALSGGQ